MACESPIQETETVDTNKLKEMQNINGDGENASIISNGIDGHKEHKDKHKEKHKHKDKHRDKDSKHKSKHSSSSSSSKDKHKSSHKDKDRSKDHKSSSKDKDRHSSSKDKDKHSSSHKDKHSSSSSKDKSKSSSSSSSKDKDKHSSSSSSKDKEHRSSSSSRDKKKDGEKDKHRDKHKDKHRDGEKKDKDKHRDKDRHKDKHREKDRDKDKHRDKDKEKERRERKEKERRERKEKERKERKEKEIKKEEPSPIKNDNDEIIVEVPIKEEIKEEVKEEVMEVEESQDSVQEVDSTEEDVKMEEEEENIKEEEEEEEEEVEEVESQEDSMDDDSQGRLVIEEEGSDNEFQPEPKEEEEEEEENYEEDNEEDEDFEIEEKPKKRSKTATPKRKRKAMDSDDDEDDFSPAAKKARKDSKNKKQKQKDTKRKSKGKKEQASPKKETASPTKGRKKKEEEAQDVWRWWEEDRGDGKVKWTSLEHKGPIFAPEYERLPKSVKFYYNGEEMALSEPCEEVAGFYARMLDHDYTSKEAFNKNFFADWHKFMNEEEKAKIKRLDKCDFTKMCAYFKMKSEENKNRTKEEKQILKEKNAALMAEYGFCILDGHKQKIGNFKIEPPGLFRGRGDHPKMGKVKRRVQPEDVIINCGKDSNIPEAPKGHRWKEVRHDNSVTWLCSWTENIQNQTKYVMLNANSRLKGEKDWMKYETARKLKNGVDKIREDYKSDWKSKEMRIRQRAVALYFIDKLALRAGNEKDSDEQADTVGCCSLRVEHITLHDELDGQECVVEFDFLGKDSIRYQNKVPVEKRVFKNLKLFMEGKADGDDLFDRLNTAMMNKYLNDLMEGLTAKVFRTYNASSTLQNQLDELTNDDDNVPAKMLSYNRANRAVAILCNHQRAVPKTFAKSMENLKVKIDDKRQQVEEAEADYRSFKKNKDHKNAEKAKKKVERLNDQLTKLEVQATDKEENKEIALGTSKLNYLDPRISVAWSKKNDVPLEKVYNKTQRDKFRWAIDMAGPEFVF